MTPEASAIASPDDGIGNGDITSDETTFCHCKSKKRSLIRTVIGCDVGSGHATRVSVSARIVGLLSNPRYPHLCSFMAAVKRILRSERVCFDIARLRSASTTSSTRTVPHSTSTSDRVTATSPSGVGSIKPVASSASYPGPLVKRCSVRKGCGAVTFAQYSKTIAAQLEKLTCRKSKGLLQLYKYIVNCTVHTQGGRIVQNYRSEERIPRHTCAPLASAALPEV
jgi:hypothetical protein